MASASRSQDPGHLLWEAPTRPGRGGKGAVTSAEPGATFPMTGRQMWASGTYQLLSLGAETITFPFGGNGLGLFIFSNLMNIKRTVIGAK